MTINGNGFTANVDNGKLVITIDISPTARAAAPKSSSGKSKLLASTHGWMAITPDGVQASLNIISK